MLIGKDLIERLHKEACLSDRLRINYDLRSEGDEISLRLLTVMEPGTIVPVHRHKDSDEFFVVLSGTIEERFYHDDGSLKESFLISVGGKICSMIIPKGQWHNVVVKEPCTAIVECRRGPYVPLQPEDVFNIQI